MRRRSLPGTAVLMAICCLMLGALPAAAGEPPAPQTLWVDEDGAAGPTRCGSATDAFESIQSAIDAASAGDTILVCPGAYVEQLSIETPYLRIRAVRQWEADIVAPTVLATTGGGSTALVHINDADGVVLREFRLRFPTTGDCSTWDAAVLVESSEKAVVRANRIAAVGGGSSFECGYQYGVAAFGIGSAPSSEPAIIVDDPVSARVVWNQIKDFQRGGVLVEGPQTTAIVIRNSIRYIHANVPLGREGPPGPETAPSGVPCGGLNCAFFFSFGVGVEAGALARVHRNAIYSGPDACPGCVVAAGDEARTPALGEGIATELRGISPADFPTIDELAITANLVLRTFNGIRVSGATGMRVAGNEVRDSATGIEIDDSDDNEIAHNITTDGGAGIRVDAGSGSNTIHDNDFRGNAHVDCQDLSTGGGTAGTANLWTENLGASSSPPGICSSTP